VLIFRFGEEQIKVWHQSVVMNVICEGAAVFVFNAGHQLMQFIHPIVQFVGILF
jgi:hypothetical protein